MIFQEFSNEQKHIYVWIKAIYYEILEHKMIQGYKYIFNKFVIPIETAFRFHEYDKILKICEEATSNIKQINGNHFHLYLFLELKQLIEKNKKNKDSMTYKMTERNATSLYYNPFYYIWSIKGTNNRKEKKRTDILIIDKKTKIEYLIHNWKRVFYDKSKNKHYWHYEIYSNGELILDGEYIGIGEWKGKQRYLINHLFEKLGLR